MGRGRKGIDCQDLNELSIGKSMAAVAEGKWGHTTSGGARA